MIRLPMAPGRALAIMLLSACTALSGCIYDGPNDEPEHQPLGPLAVLKADRTDGQGANKPGPEDWIVAWSDLPNGSRAPELPLVFWYADNAPMKRGGFQMTRYYGTDAEGIERAESIVRNLADSAQGPKGQDPASAQTVFVEYQGHTYRVYYDIYVS